MLVSPSLENQRQQAAYVCIGSALRVANGGVVLPLILTKRVMFLASWNLPLRYMASLAHQGPDIGDGPIKVLTAEDPVEPEYLTTPLALWKRSRRSPDVHPARR